MDTIGRPDKVVHTCRGVRAGVSKKMNLPCIPAAPAAQTVAAGQGGACSLPEVVGVSDWPCIRANPSRRKTESLGDARVQKWHTLITLVGIPQALCFSARRIQFLDSNRQFVHVKHYWCGLEPCLPLFGRDRLRVGDHTLAGPLWEGCRESRKCSRDTYPESYITKYTSIRRETCPTLVQSWTCVRS